MKKRIIFIISIIIILIFIIFNISIKGDNEIKISYTENYIDEGYKSFIKCNTKNNVKSKPGKYKVIYSNLLFKKIRTVNVIDDKAPSIEVPLETIFLKINSEFDNQKIKAYDEIDGDLTKKIEVINNVDNKKVGSYKISYLVSDKSGNKAKKVIIVNVVEDLFKED